MRENLMNIVHFTTGRVNPAAAKVGLVNVIYWLADAQAKAGHHVSVVVCPVKRDYENATQAAFEIREYPYSILGGMFVEKQLLSDIQLGSLKIDIAHLHGVWNMHMAAIGSALYKLGIPYVVSSHGSFAPMILRKQRMLKQAFRILRGLPLVNHASFVHVHSKHEVNDARAFGVRSPIVVAGQGFNAKSIPAGISRKWIAEKYPQHANAFKMVFLGRLDPWVKGIDLLLEGFSCALANSGDVTLFLIGPEKRMYRDKAPEWVAKLGLTDRVVFVGPLYDPTEKFSALASADLFVLTSRFEGFPLTALEAMACGTPVMVTPGTNVADLVAENGAGIVCDGDPGAIAAGIVTATSSAADLSSMGARARSLAERMTWEKTASALDSAYAEVLQRRRA